jgi:GNAT superfamily N-acetyltransferase
MANVVPLSPAWLDQAGEVFVAAGVATVRPVVAEKLFGDAPDGARTTAVAAVEDGRAVGVAAASGRWLRVLLVAPACRHRGVGTALLGAMERACRDAGAKTMRTLDQPGNYLAPGVDAEDRDTLAWLTRRGFTVAATNVSLVVDVADNWRVSAARAVDLAERARAGGLAARRAEAAEAAAIVDWIADRFAAAWAFEAERALGFDPPGVHVAASIDDGALAAFAAHDGNNRGLGWFGPAGTLPAQRGRGLGAALLLACLVDVAAAGHARSVIPWIGPRGFYERTVGIVGERRHVVLEKRL